MNNEKARNLRAAKYCAEAALRKVADEKWMDHFVVQSLRVSVSMFVFALALAMVVG